MAAFFQKVNVKWGRRDRIDEKLCFRGFPIQKTIGIKFKLPSPLEFTRKKNQKFMWTYNF